MGRQDIDGLRTTWTGTALTLLTAGFCFLAVLYPTERRLLWILCAACAVGALLSFLRVFTLRQRVFTSDGLEWNSRASSRARGNLQTLVNVKPCESEGPLPQPLILRVRCLRKPTEDPGPYAIFYPDLEKLDCRPFLVPAEIKGKSVYVTLSERKLRPPAMLDVTLHGIAREEIESVQYRQ